MSVESTSATTPAVTKAAKRDDHTKANDGSEETTKVNLPRCASIPRERGLNTQYMTNPTTVYPVKMEYG